MDIDGSLISETPARMFRLFCYILGGHDAFRVDVEDGGDVDDLKESILKKNQNRLKGVDAPQLKLWKVCAFNFQLWLST